MALNATAGFWGLIILMCWQQIGYMMIIYIAGLQSIPSDYLEAARNRRRHPWQTLWKVKIPMVMPSITICLFLSMTNSFKLFDQNLALTGGEPGPCLRDAGAEHLQHVLRPLRTQWKGIGQAKAVIFFILVVAIGLIQLRSTRAREVQQ
jgi:raffinose/stachyose/melibiose transport system permease protein